MISIEIINIVVEIEMPVGHGHGARVGPVGDVDVMAGQKGFDRAAQQRRIMAGHRRDDQQLGLLRRSTGELPLETQQFAERARPDIFLDDRDFFAADRGRVKAEDRLAVAARHALEKFGRSRNIAGERSVGEGVEGTLEELQGGVRQRARRGERQMQHLVYLIGNTYPFDASPRMASRLTATAAAGRAMLRCTNSLIQ